MKKVLLTTFLIFSMVILISPNGQAAKKHITNESVEPTVTTRTAPEPHTMSLLDELLPFANSWVYSRKDDNGNSQIFLQFLESENLETFPEYQATDSSSGNDHIINRRSPKLGGFDFLQFASFDSEGWPEVADVLEVSYPGAVAPIFPLRYKEQISDSNWQECVNPVIFLYIGTDTNTNKDNLYMGCFNYGSKEIAYFDVPLTNIPGVREFGNVSSFDIGENALSILPMIAEQAEAPGIDLNQDGVIGDIDFDSDPATANFGEIPAKGPVFHHQVAFGTDDGKLHYLTFSPLFLYGDAINSDFLVYNEQTLNSTSFWPVDGVPTSHDSIDEIKFADIFFEGTNPELTSTIAFIGSDGDQSHVGMINYKGDQLSQLTNVPGYKFYHLETNKDVIVPAPFIFFSGHDVENDTNSQIFQMTAGLLTPDNLMTEISWRDEIMALTPKEDHSRIYPDLHFGYLYYSREQDDGYHDVYQYSYIPEEATTPSSSSASISPGETYDTELPTLTFQLLRWIIDLIIASSSGTPVPPYGMTPSIEPVTFAEPFAIQATEFLPISASDNFTLLTHFEEKRLTCSGDNLKPEFFAQKFDNAYLPLPASGSESFPFDLLHLERNTATQETRISHLYALDTRVQCPDTCTENGDRSPIIDTDNDGLHDERVDPFTGEKCDDQVGTPPPPDAQEAPEDPFSGGFHLHGGACGCDFNATRPPLGYMALGFSAFGFLFLGYLILRRRSQS